MPLPLDRKVPAFACDGRRLRGYTPEACERLVQLSKATATRNARGEIRAIHFRDIDGGAALRVVATMGQRYSYLAQVGDVNLWQFKDLAGDPSDFARVVEDVLAEAA